MDVFAGTGIMSVEALSRGASLAHLVECNKKTKITLVKNFSFVEEFYKFFFQKAEDFLGKKIFFMILFILILLLIIKIRLICLRLFQKVKF